MLWLYLNGETSSFENYILNFNMLATEYSLLVKSLTLVQI